MREIKFRAWDIENKTMHCSPVVAKGKRLKDVNTGRTEEQMSLCINDAFVPTLKWMQYTGLKDKNGVEIYEGDVLEEVSTSDGFVGEVKFGTYEVHDMNDCGTQDVHGYYLEGKWKLHDGRVFDRVSNLNDAKYSEIIGNIYQNPELLTPEGSC